jgi:hypothetical protein
VWIVVTPPAAEGTAAAPCAPQKANLVAGQTESAEVAL